MFIAGILASFSPQIDNAKKEASMSHVYLIYIDEQVLVVPGKAKFVLALVSDR